MKLEDQSITVASILAYEKSLKPGFLVFRCKRCGQEFYNDDPDCCDYRERIADDLCRLVDEVSLDNIPGGCALHTCSPGEYGVGELVGGTETDRRPDSNEDD
jgi:hypothetical protein